MYMYHIHMSRLKYLFDLGIFSENVHIFVLYMLRYHVHTYLESAFSLYSIDVNFDNSQSNIGIMWKGAFFGIVFVSHEIQPKWGYPFLVHITGSRSPTSRMR